MVTILAALLDGLEKEKLSSVLAGEGGDVELLYLDSLADLDNILETRDVDIILLDFQYQNGALADWLSLWPLPYIIIASVEETDRLEGTLKDETSSFIIREPSLRYLEVIPLVVRKVLYYRELADIQNRHLQLSERRYLELVQALPDVVYHIDEHGEFQFINDSVKMLGYEPIELIGRHFTEIIDAEEADKVSRCVVLKELQGRSTGAENAPKLFDERRSGSRKTSNLLVKLKKKNGDESGRKILGSIISYGEVSSVGFSEAESKEAGRGTVGIIRDVTEKVEKEKLLKNSLEEKTILLREIHHRVKNNLQIILSLLNLHSHEFKETGPPSILREIESEIHSMAMVHDQLCHSESLGRIDMQEYIETLSHRLCDIYDFDSSRITYTISAKDIFLKLEKATPVGLIINELVSNALKYAFTEQKMGTMLVEFANDSDGYFTLLIKDDGTGFSSLLRKSEWMNIGLQLVELLVDQLEGTVRYENDNGASIRIRIPEGVLTGT